MKNIVLLMLFVAIAYISGFAKKNSNNAKYKATFIELGTVKCIPCKKMQPILKSIEQKYPKQVKVIFYDVWKPEEKEYGEIYKINLIPTQVFFRQKWQRIFPPRRIFP